MGYFSGSVRELAWSHFFDVQLSNALMGVGTSVEVPILTMVGRQLGYGESTIASYVTLIAVCRVLADIPTGLLAECVDVRRLMSLSVLAQVVGCGIVLVMQPGPLSLSIFSVVSGCSIGIFFLTRHIYVARISKPEHRGIVMSFLSGMLRWSHVLGPVLLGVVASSWKDGRHFFAIPLVAAAAACLCVECGGGCPCSRKEGSPDGASAREMILFPNDNDGVASSCPPPPAPAAAAAVDVDVAACEETSLLLPSLLPSSLPTSYEGTAVANSVQSNAKSLNAAVSVFATLDCSCIMRTSEGRFRLAALWQTVVENWCTIWRLGLYIILYVALRANRKLLLTFAAMRLGFTDSQVAFLLSVGFAFDACLFPLGGIVMDMYGRRYAMVPVVLGLGVAFVLLPLWQNSMWLYTMAAAFGIADALGCGLIMTLIADQAPQRFGGPFFGIMRTVQDMGHVVGATVVSVGIRHVDFAVLCRIWGGVGVLTALWARFGVPVDME